jgi:hypothetical protein
MARSSDEVEYDCEVFANRCVEIPEAGQIKSAVAIGIPPSQEDVCYPLGLMSVATGDPEQSVEGGCFTLCPYIFAFTEGLTITVLFDHGRVRRHDVALRCKNRPQRLDQLTPVAVLDDKSMRAKYPLSLPMAPINEGDKPSTCSSLWR